ncbi:MAG: hypothetical protein WCK18_08535 [Prolixibacteraceae bacterium]
MENSFENNVFINCPFDSEYFNLLKPLLFTVMACGFNPRIALERFDSGESRIDKIRELIEESRLSIHDLSRIKSTKRNELFRLNMPYEIGLDFGCKIYHTNTKYRKKKSLILEGEKYSCQKALSDIASSDVKCHDNDSEVLVSELRNWFAELGRTDLKSGSSIWDDYNVFYTDFFVDRTSHGFKEKDIDSIPIPEFIGFIQGYIDR